MSDQILVDQIGAEVVPYLTDPYCCLELSLPGGQRVASLLVRTVPVEVIATDILPAVRAEMGLSMPLNFKARALTAQEHAELNALQAGG